MKRILICTTNYLPHIGGAEIAIDEITRHAQDTYEYDLITAQMERGLPKKEKMGNVMVYRVGFGMALDKFLLPIWGLVKFVSLRFSKKYDAVWSMMASHGSILASIISILFRIPVLLTLQEGDEEKHLERYVRGNKLLYKMFIFPWYVLIFKRAKRITVISEYLKERARLHSRAPIDLVPNGVDFDLFTPDLEDSRVQKITESYNLSGKKVVVSVSRLVYKNNIEILIKALPYIPTDTVLLIVGDGNKRKELEDLVETLRVSDRVIFAGKARPHDVPPYLWVSHVFARISKSEGFGSAFLEAFVAEVPVVASPVGGIVDIVTDDKTGLLVPPHDEKKVAHAILKLLSDDSLRRRIVSDAHTLAKTYTWKSVARQMEQSFDQL